MGNIAAFAVPLVITAVGAAFLFSKKDLVPLFLSGCRSGMDTTVSLLPTLILLIVAVKMFSASGALEFFCSFLSPLFSLAGIPSEILPVVIMRPISGSGATAMIKELFDICGADSLASFCASILMGSSDTVIYTLSVYFSHTKTKQTGYAFPVCFTVLVFCTLLSCALARLFI